MLKNFLKFFVIRSFFLNMITEISDWIQLNRYAYKLIFGLVEIAKNFMKKIDSVQRKTFWSY